MDRTSSLTSSLRSLLDDSGVFQILSQCLTVAADAQRLRLAKETQQLCTPGSQDLSQALVDVPAILQKLVDGEVAQWRRTYSAGWEMRVPTGSVDNSLQTVSQEPADSYRDGGPVFERPDDLAVHKTEAAGALKRPRETAQSYGCVFFEHNPRRQYGSMFKCTTRRGLRDLRNHVRNHVRPFYCETCCFNSADKKSLDIHNCNPALNKYKFPRRTAEECARNEKLVLPKISLESMKRLLFEPCLDEKCDCDQKNSTATSNAQSATLEDTKHQRILVQVLDAAQASISQFDILHNTGVNEAWNGGSIFDGNIDAQDTECRTPDPHIASLEMFTGKLSEPTIDPRQLMFEGPERELLPWRNNMISGPFDYCDMGRGHITSSRSHKTTSISETISSLASLSLGMPAQKKSRSREPGELSPTSNLGECELGRRETPQQPQPSSQLPFHEECNVQELFDDDPFFSTYIHV